MSSMAYSYFPGGYFDADGAPHFLHTADLVDCARLHSPLSNADFLIDKTIVLWLK